MSDEKTIKTTKSKVLVSKKKNKIVDGLFTSTKTQYDSLEAMEADRPYGEGNKGYIDYVLDNLENIARKAAKDAGLEVDSTLQIIEEPVIEDGEVRRTRTRRAAHGAEPLSLMDFAYRLESQVAMVRKRIKEFEQATDDPNILTRFYLTVRLALDMTESTALLYLKQNEEAIVKQREREKDRQKGNKNKIQSAQQKAQELHRQYKEINGKSYHARCTKLSEKTGVSVSQIKRSIDKNGKLNNP